MCEKIEELKRITWDSSIKFKGLLKKKRRKSSRDAGAAMLYVEWNERGEGGHTVHRWIGASEQRGLHGLVCHAGMQEDKLRDDGLQG